MPLLALLLLAAVSAMRTNAVRGSPGARLLTSAQALCTALAGGEADAALAHVQPSLGARQRITRAAAALRGAQWLVVRVDPDQGTTTVLWGQAVADEEAEPRVWQWRQQSHGGWKLVL